MLYACYADISLFDDLENLGDADNLLDALQLAGYVSILSRQYANVQKQEINLLINS